MYLKCQDDAHLNIETHAGQAWVGLHVRLGHAPGPLHHQPHSPPTHRNKNSPSRQRRRARRAAAKKKAEEAPEENDRKAEEATTANVGNLPNVKNIEVENQYSDMNEDLKNVNDEFCPEEDYQNVETAGITPFRCHECRMLFLPENYAEGNTIENFESFRRYLGVLKCKQCAIVLVGLAKIGCHIRVCHYSA